MFAGANVPLRVLSQTKRPSIGGAKTSGEFSATFPIWSAGIISPAKRSSKVLFGSSLREGRRSCATGSAAKPETARERKKASARQRCVMSELRSDRRRSFNQYCESKIDG